VKPSGGRSKERSAGETSCTFSYADESV